MYTQCAAVRTCVELTSMAPQLKSSDWSMMETIQGQAPCTAGSPPANLLADCHRLSVRQKKSYVLLFSSQTTN